MVFIVPIIVGVLAAGSSVVGVGAVSKGVMSIAEAQSRGKAAQARHELNIKQLNARYTETNRLAGSYGKLLLRVRKKVIGRFIEFIQRNGRKASKSEQQILEGFEGISIEQLQEFQALVFEAEEILKSVFDAATTGFAAGSGAVGVANAVGAVAVPQFFGLFTKQVAVAELGLPGVALYLGGGNALIGGAVLGGVAIGPALTVAGFQLAKEGEKALTQVQSYEAEVNAKVAQLETQRKFLEKIERRIREVGIVVRKLEKRAIEGLDELETLDFDPVRDAAKFQQVALLVKALAEISKTQILDDEGNLNPAIVNIRAKYQHLGD